jgi:flagellar biosynthesis protein FlhF
MKIRRFTAATTAEALAQVKAALGPDAVLLDTASVGGRVVVTAATDDAETAVAPQAELVGEVRQLIRAVRALVAQAPAPPLPDDADGLRRALVAQGVDAAIARALASAAARRTDAGRALPDAVRDVLAEATPPRAAARVRVFVGAPGDGKTTTVVKLAAHARRAGQRVVLAGADTWRIGATAELEAYGRALGVPVARVGSPAELHAAVAAHAGADLVLVDTAGASPGQADALAELSALVAAAGPEAGRTLVASATASGAAMAQLDAAFAPLAPDACVLTKLDAAAGAAALSVAWRRGLAVTHLGTGRRIPDDLEPATPERLARCLLAA